VRAPAILLPPSEGKSAGGTAPSPAAAAHSFPELDADRAVVREAVRVVLAGGADAAAGLLGVGGRHLAQARADWEDLEAGPVMVACLRYSGVVWAALDPDTLGRAPRRRLDERVLVTSGLWGLVAACDPIPAYRLRMGARVPAIGPLAAFWRPCITALIDRRAAGGWVIDLLPQEHAAAIDATGLVESRLMRVVLVEEGDARRAVGHAGKALKGRLARAILEADARTPRSVAALSVPGLRCEGVSARAGAVEVVFTRLATRPAPSNMLVA
jgi:cytoplasmic iron level regulating protein YaaA (DUF328/UPF0246 family)